VPSAATGLASALRQRTRDLHSRAERSGIIRDLVRGQADRAGYALLLRNLLPVYQALEQALRVSHQHGQLDGIGGAGLERAPALIADLTAIQGANWHAELPLLPAGIRYAHRVARAAQGPPGLLAAHAYVRYLGDLSGGQILSRVLSRSLGLGPAALRLYAFPAVPDVAAARQRFNTAIELAAPTAAEQRSLLAEALVAFRLNIALSEAVRIAMAPRSADLLAGTAA
jgi:heme oxygenase